jgi:RNA 2',3'-cyclic 3'-phosphodiesterase
MRCFVAIELPGEIHERLAELQEQLNRFGRAVRWTDPYQIHLTMKFLGEVPEQQVAEVCELATEIANDHAACQLKVAGTGCFPPGGAVRVIWAGLERLPQSLVDCHRACEKGFAGMGFKKENRAFRPHLTLGRVKDHSVSREVREVLEEWQDFVGGEFTAEGLTVFQSVLKREGPTYLQLAHAPFEK